MRILVDADACPVKPQILRVAAREGVPVVLLASHAHEVAEAPGVSVMRVESSPQAVDIALVNEAKPGDVVVTGDYGLACMCLGKRARALSFRGQPYTDTNIDALMATRHLAARARRGGGRMRGPRPFSPDDAARFEAALERMLRESE